MMCNLAMIPMNSRHAVSAIKGHALLRLSQVRKHIGSMTPIPIFESSGVESGHVERVNNAERAPQVPGLHHTLRLRVLTMSSRASSLGAAGSRARSCTVLSRGSPGTICHTPHSEATEQHTLDRDDGRCPTSVAAICEAAYSLLKG